jgi:hypothetical protein
MIFIGCCWLFSLYWRFFATFSLLIFIAIFISHYIIFIIIDCHWAGFRYVTLSIFIDIFAIFDIFIIFMPLRLSLTDIY